MPVKVLSAGLKEDRDSRSRSVEKTRLKEQISDNAP